MRDTRVRNFMWSLGYVGCLVVSSIGQSGSLDLFWSVDVDVSLKASSARCIDVHVTPKDGST